MCFRFSSVTHANKAKDALGRNCISSKMRRTAGGSGGCGYVLETDASKAEKALEILNACGIKYNTGGCDEI